jgi:hypothetical protein
MLQDRGRWGHCCKAQYLSRSRQQILISPIQVVLYWVVQLMVIHHLTSLGSTLQDMKFQVFRASGKNIKDSL